MFSFLSMGFAYVKAYIFGILLIGMVAYAGVLKYENWDLKGDVASLKTDLKKCRTEKAILKTQVQGYSDQMSFMEQQCDERVRYEKNKPKVPVEEVNPSDVDDKYLNDLFSGRVRTPKNPATGNNPNVQPPGKGGSSGPPR